VSVSPHRHELGVPPLADDGAAEVNSDDHVLGVLEAIGGLVDQAPGVDREIFTLLIDARITVHVADDDGLLTAPEILEVGVLA
jgi:hypothetical protein